MTSEITSKKRKTPDIDYKLLYEQVIAEKEELIAEKEELIAEKEELIAEKGEENLKLRKILDTEKDERLSVFSTRMRSSSGGHSKASKQIKKYYSKTCLFCGTTENITCAHIVAGNKDVDYKSYGKPIYKSNLDYKSNKNYIPLCGTLGVEGTCHNDFDKYLMTLIYNPLDRAYSIFCLDSKSPRYKDLHGKVIKLHKNHKPYTRLLSWRLKHCIRSNPDLVKDDIRDLYILGNMGEHSKSIANASATDTMVS
jgi:hypothetical protein